MAKFNSWGSKPFVPKFKSEDFFFEGEKITLVQQLLSTPEEYKAADEALALTEKHVLNDEGDNDPEPFFDLLTGEGIPVSRLLFVNCASIAAAQPTHISQAERYTTAELVGMANKLGRTPEGKKEWKRLTTFAKEIQGKGAEDEAKNDFGRQDTLPSSTPTPDSTANTSA